MRRRSGVCIPLHFTVFIHVAAPVHAFQLALVNLCLPRSAVVHMCMDPSGLGVVSGLFWQFAVSTLQWSRLLAGS